MNLPPIPSSAVRFEQHPGNAARLVAILDAGEWRVWVINLDGPAAIAAADQLAAAVRGATGGR